MLMTIVCVTDFLMLMLNSVHLNCCTVCAYVHVDFIKSPIKSNALR